MTTSPWAFLNEINTNKQNIIADDPSVETEYVPFIVNNSLSYFPDTIEYANIMNRCYHLDNKLQFDFLLNIVRRKKRFSKWSKKNKDSDVEAVCAWFKYSRSKAQSVIRLLSSDQIKTIKEQVSSVE